MNSPVKKLLRSCPVCQSDVGFFLYKQKFVLPDKHPLRNGYDVVLCPQCGFLFADSSVTQHDYDVYYADFSKYEDNHTSTGGGGSGFDAQRIEDVANQITQVLGDRSLRIADIGCANGGILKKLKESGFENIVGIDPSQACVAYIRDQLSIEAHRASVFDIPASLGQFDLIILSHVMEHILDLQGCIKEVSKFLAPHGRLYIEVPDANRYVDFITSPYQDFNTEHINHFTQHSLDNLFENSGFEKISGGIKTIESAPSVPYPALYAFYKKTELDHLVKFTSDEEIGFRIDAYIKNSQKIVDDINDYLRRNFNREEGILVWGTGQLTLKLLAMSELPDFRILNFVDSNPILKGKSLIDIPIKHPSQLSDLDSGVKILITSTIHETEIREDIEKLYRLKNPIFGLRDCLKIKL